MNELSIGRHHVEDVMGMAVSIDIRDPECPAEAVVELVEWLHHIDGTFSTYKVDSPISALGRGEILLSQTTEEIRQVLRACERIKADTEGAFDIFEVPAPNGTRLDPSGYVKGWAVERGAEILEAWGCGNFVINAGGDIAIRGHAAGTTPWRVGIRHPDDRTKLALVVEASDHLAIATSATYERGAHIVDPRSGQPTVSVASATVVGLDLGLADAYATACFVMGRDALDWIEQRPGYELYLITYEDQTYWSPGFSRYRAVADEAS